MHSFKASRQGRLIAGIMGSMLLVIVLLSFFFAAAEADHDCCGEDCRICACILLCEKALHGFGSGMAARAAAPVPAAFVLLGAALLAAVIFRETPVSVKVRMND